MLFMVSSLGACFSLSWLEHVSLLELVCLLVVSELPDSNAGLAFPHSAWGLEGGPLQSLLTSLTLCLPIGRLSPSLKEFHPRGTGQNLYQIVPVSLLRRPRVSS